MQTQYRDRPSEQGSAVSFVIVGLVLVAMLVGGIILIKGRSSQVANTATQTVAQPTKDNKAKADEAKPSTTESTKEDAKPTESTSTPPATTPVTPAPVSPAPSQTTPAPSLVATGGSIAATGPTETFATMLILGAITVVSVRYFQSRSQTARQ